MRVNVGNFLYYVKGIVIGKCQIVNILVEKEVYAIEVDKDESSIRA